MSTFDDFVVLLIVIYWSLNYMFLISLIVIIKVVICNELSKVFF